MMELSYTFALIRKAGKASPRGAFHQPPTGGSSPNMLPRCQFSVAGKTKKHWEPNTANYFTLATICAVKVDPSSAHWPLPYPGCQSLQ
jgi:hypothetical protein